jgi:hypothetical protein
MELKLSTSFTWRVCSRRFYCAVSSFCRERPRHRTRSVLMNTSLFPVLLVCKFGWETEIEAYVYWTVHHLTSWINRTNLMWLYESFLLLNMFRKLLHSSSGADDRMWVYCSVSVCTGVLVRFGWSRVVSECRLEHVMLQPALPTWCHFMKFFYCSTCFESYYIHPQELTTVCGCTALFRCVLVYWCGLAGVGWYPNAG